MEKKNNSDEKVDPELSFLRNKLLNIAKQHAEEEKKQEDEDMHLILQHLIDMENISMNKFMKKYPGFKYSKDTIKKIYNEKMVIHKK